MNAPQDQQAFRLVGTSPIRPDGVEKVTGKAVYGPDFTMAGMLHGAILRSPHPHARIRGINTRKAEALPGVKAVMTGKDFPEVEGEVAGGEGGAANLGHIARNCMAREKALYDGHAVAAVAATSKLIAEQALALIEVDYEVLPHVIEVAEALAPDAPLLHDDVFTKGLEEAPERPSNLSMRFVIDRGDPDAALAGAAIVVSGSYSTQPVHQGYIEPHAAVASWNGDGQAQIWSSSQGHFMVRQTTANLLGMNLADLRVTPLEIGGGFGGKTAIYLEPVALLLSRKAGRPVRIAMRREDVFRATGPAPGSEIEIKLGADAEGTLVGAVMEFRNRAGAFPGGDVSLSAMMALAHYRCDNVRITGWEVLVNTPSTAAYRAPGAPQTVFAVECCLDEIAQRLGMDPLDLRLKNAARAGDPGVFGMPLGEVGYAECLEAAKAHPHYSAPLGPNQGRGIAGGNWMNYGGPSTASVSVAEDGTVLVATGSPDIGGSRASMAIMAAETLGIPYENVRVTVADTASLGPSMLTGGSRVTFATGKAVIDACEQVIETLRQRAAAMFGVTPQEIEWRDGAAFCTAEGKSDQKATLAELAAKADHSGGPIAKMVGTFVPGHLPGSGVHICDTEVDPETGNVSVVRYTVVQDVGRAIHADYCEGQLQGGAAQGIGWALNEAYVFGPSGKMDNAGFLDYRMPVASDLPMIDTVMVEVPNPNHPFGVKGVGETPIVPPLGAVANAVSRATGVRMYDLPLTPDRIRATLQAAQ